MSYLIITVTTVFKFLLLMRLSKGDEYINEVQGQCYNKDRLEIFSCAKLKFLRYLKENQIQPIDSWDFGYGILKLKKIQDANATIPEIRQFKDDSEIIKFWKFLKRHAYEFLVHQGVGIDLPDGARIIEDYEVQKRGRKKKTLMLSALILFKLFNLQILTALTLAGVVLIKKTIVIAAIALPHLIQNLKSFCKTSYQIVPQPYTEDVYHKTHSHEHSYNPYSNGQEQSAGGFSY